MEYEIKLIELQEQPTLTLREVHPVEKLPDFFGKAYSTIGAYLQELQESPAGAPFAAYYNMEMTALDIEAGFPVHKKLPAKGDISSNALPTGLYISTIHTGPYNTMEPAYNALTKWAEDNGYKTSGIAYEYYLNDPADEKETQILTEVRLPVTKKSP